MLREFNDRLKGLSTAGTTLDTATPFSLSGAIRRLFSQRFNAGRKKRDFTCGVGVDHVATGAFRGLEMSKRANEVELLPISTVRSKERTTHFR